MYNKSELIAGKFDNSTDKYKFVVEYAKSKGWDINNLNDAQLMEIRSQEGYKKSGMMLS